ncbi:Cys/Met metabolism, pyridoxal phosphate-dependent enzyme, partial [mine drainage metagenome]
AITDLEDGHGAVAFASGMAGVAAVLALVPKGAKVVAARDSYTGTRELLLQLEAAGRFEVELIDTTDHDALGRAAAGAAMIWLETLGNPLLSVPDLARGAMVSRQAGALLVSTTPSPRRSCARPLTSVRTWSCTPRPSTSAATMT